MVGREAYHNPWWLASWDANFFKAGHSELPGLTESKGAIQRELTREVVEEQMVAYMEREVVKDGTPWSAISRHMLGLRHGQPGARRWRQVWSDHRLKPLPARQVMVIAREAAEMLERSES